MVRVSDGGISIKAEGADAAAAMITERAQGLQVRDFQIFGPNSLKTLTDPAALVGESLRAVDVAAGLLVLTFDTRLVEVDFQRTGAVVWSPASAPWAAEGGSRPPTGRLLLEDGAGIDFIEPGKTKRIRFWVRDLPGC